MKAYKTNYVKNKGCYKEDTQTLRIHHSLLNFKLVAK